MNSIIAVLVAGLVLNVSQAYAANGDLLVGGNLGVGLAPSTAPVNGLHVKGTIYPNNTIMAEGNEITGGSGFLAYTSRSDNQLPRANDRLGFFYFGSYNLAANAGDPSASPFHPTGITGTAEQDWTTTSIPANIVFSTTASGSTYRAERVRIAGNGNVGIGTLANPGTNNKLEVKDGHLTTTQTTVPTALPSSGSATVSGSDNRGVISVTGIASSVVLTFNMPWALAPVCVASSTTVMAVSTTTTSTTATFGFTSTTNPKINFICL